MAEVPGEGVTGLIDGKRFVVGGEAFVVRAIGGREDSRPGIAAGSLTVPVAGRLVGHS